MKPDQCTKYPRTPHLPWSPGGSSDDAYLFDCSHFEGREVVVTEKMDGENTTLYCDGLHARSVDGRHHPSRAWVKRLHATIATQIPHGWRFCGENLYARHSIEYRKLRSYFYLFSIWNADNVALSWDDTAAMARSLHLETVSELYRGAWDESVMHQITGELNVETQEGIVVRLADGFSFDHFSGSIAKWVRKGHVNTGGHWMCSEIVPNTLEQRERRKP